MSSLKGNLLSSCVCAGQCQEFFFFRFASIVSKMARVLSELLQQRKKVVAKPLLKRSQHDVGGHERGHGKRKVKKTDRFEFAENHILFSESTKKHEDKVNNRIYMQTFRASKLSKTGINESSEKQNNLKMKQLERTVKKQTEIIKKMKEINKMKLKKLSVENRKLKKIKAGSNEE